MCCHRLDDMVCPLTHHVVVNIIRRCSPMYHRNVAPAARVKTGEGERTHIAHLDVDRRLSSGGRRSAVVG
jgi:hypothetical protein